MVRNVKLKKILSAFFEKQVFSTIPKKHVIRNSYRDAIFNRAVLHLRSTSFKSICKKVQFLANLNVIGFQFY